MIHTIPTLSSPFMYVEDEIYFGSPVALENLWRVEENKANFYPASSFALRESYNNDFEALIKKSYDMAKDQGQIVAAFHERGGKNV